MLCYVLGTVVVMHSDYKAMLIALLCYRKCGSYAFTGEVYVISIVILLELWYSCIHSTILCYLLRYVIGIVGVRHSEYKSMLFALLCSSNCGSRAFTGKGYVISIVML
jgi:RNase P/RNase MRP subunit POP5